MKNIDESYQYLAATRIEPQLQALAMQLTGARTAEEVECVHQSRVASRRLRSALKMFGGCFPPKKFKRWRNCVREITRQLGEARDLDVQMIQIEKCIAALGPEERRAYRSGLARLLLRLEQQRQAVQPEVVKAIDTFERSGVLEEMHGEVAAAIFGFSRRQLGFGSAYVFGQAAKHSTKRVAELISHESALSDAAAMKQHHAMRIAAKRLRYTLEICEPAFDGALVPHIKSAKKLQTLLGDIHDCDVWAVLLDQFIEAERERTRAYFGHGRPFTLLLPGIEYLRAERKAARERLFGEVVEYWARLRADGDWEALVHMVQARAEEAQRAETEVEAGAALEDAEQVELEADPALLGDCEDRLHHADEDEANDSGIAGGCTRESAGPGAGAG